MKAIRNREGHLDSATRNVAIRSRRKSEGILKAMRFCGAQRNPRVISDTMIIHPLIKGKAVLHQVESARDWDHCRPVLKDLPGLSLANFFRDPAAFRVRELRVLFGRHQPTAA